MAQMQTAPPTVEPLTLSEVKAFLRIDHGEEDALLTTLITTTRLQVEAALDLGLNTQVWEVSGPRDGRPCVAIAIRPVASVTSVEIEGRDGTRTPLSAGDYMIEEAAGATHIDVERALPRDARVVATVTVGFGDTADDVPEPIRHALKLLVAHWYEHRDPASVECASRKIPEGISALLAPYRRVTL